MKIEAGKRYVTRGGWVTPELELSEATGMYEASWCEWKDDGTFVEREGEDGYEYDLVAEEAEPTLTKPSRLEIAARVLAGIVGAPDAPDRGMAEMTEEALYFADALIAAERETRE